MEKWIGILVCVLIAVGMFWFAFRKQIETFLATSSTASPGSTRRWNLKWTGYLKWFFGIILGFGVIWFLITRVSCGSRSVSRHESPVYTPSADTTFVVTAVDQQFFISKPYKGMVIEVKNTQENHLDFSWYAEKKDLQKIRSEVFGTSVFYRITKDSVRYIQIKIK